MPAKRLLVEKPPGPHELHENSVVRPAAGPEKLVEVRGRTVAPHFDAGQPPVVIPGIPVDLPDPARVISSPDERAVEFDEHPFEDREPLDGLLEPDPEGVAGQPAGRLDHRPLAPPVVEMTRRLDLPPQRMEDDVEGIPRWFFHGATSSRHARPPGLQSCGLPPGTERVSTVPSPSPSPSPTLARAQAAYAAEAVTVVERISGVW
jgi:hypothetical protein